MIRFCIVSLALFLSPYHALAGKICKPARSNCVLPKIPAHSLSNEDVALNLNYTFAPHYFHFESSESMEVFNQMLREVEVDIDQILAQVATLKLNHPAHPKTPSFYDILCAFVEFGKLAKESLGFWEYFRPSFLDFGSRTEGFLRGVDWLIEILWGMGQQQSDNCVGGVGPFHLELEVDVSQIVKAIEKIGDSKVIVVQHPDKDDDPSKDDTKKQYFSWQTIVNGIGIIGSIASVVGICLAVRRDEELDRRLDAIDASLSIVNRNIVLFAGIMLILIFVVLAIFLYTNDRTVPQIIQPVRAVESTPQNVDIDIKMPDEWIYSGIKFWVIVLLIALLSGLCAYLYIRLYKLKHFLASNERESKMKERVSNLERSLRRRSRR